MTDRLKQEGIFFLIKALESQKKDFVKIENTTIYNSSNNGFVKKVKSIEDKYNVVLALCLTEEDDFIRVGLTLLDKSGELIVNKYDSQYAKLKGLLANIGCN